MNGEAPVSGNQQGSIEHPQWPRGLVMLVPVGVYAGLVAIGAALIWHMAIFSAIGGWGLLIALVISAVGFAFLAGLLLVISSLALNLVMRYPASSVAREDDR